jgi:hypothetical protein
MITQAFGEESMSRTRKECFKIRFKDRWFGRAAPIAWRPCSKDLTLLDFFLWGFVKDRAFVPSSPVNVVELETRVIAAVAEVTPEMLRSVSQEIDYKSDVYHITTVSHTEP